MGSRLDKHETEIRRLLCRGHTQKEVAGRFQVHPVTLCNWLKRKRRSWMIRK